MHDARLKAWADVLTHYCVNVQPNDKTVIIGGVAAEPLLRAIYRSVIEAGGMPVMVPEFPGLIPEVLQFGDDEQIAWVSPIEQYSRESADVLIRISAETNTRAGSEVPPSRSAIHTRARAALRQTFSERAARGDLRWTLSMFPTDAYAQDAEMSTTDYAEFFYRACKLNEADPVAAWVRQREDQARLIDWVSPRREMHVRGPGTDLRVSVAGRTWINSDGKRNFPSGEIFTGPVEDSAEGVIHCSFPVIEGGREIADIRLRFEAGVVVDASASKNEAYLVQALDIDEGARRLGEAAIGTNFDITRFTRQILLDEKIGGTAHFAVGSGYPETGSSNRSAIHWDLIVDLRQTGTISFDGEPFVVDGKIVI